MPILAPFAEVALLLVMAAGLGLIGTLARRSLIVSFIAIGLIARPSALDAVRSDAQINLLSELGIAVLLFLVGIKLDVKLIRSPGVVPVMTGLGQVIFAAFFGYLIGLALGLGHVTSLYVAVALTFSSTILIVKLLSDTREIDALHGQIALGLPIVQGLIVMLAMIGLTAIGIGAANAGHGGGSVATGLALVAAVLLFARYAADPLTERLAGAPEVLMSVAIALAAMCAAVGDVVGLGKQVGGLMTDVALASTPYGETITARLAPLRDFLFLFFFIPLGATPDLSPLGAPATGAVLFSMFVLIGYPLSVLAIKGTMGYLKRTGFLAGLTVAKISELSSIFAAMGVSIGHVTEDALGLVSMVGLVTIAASTHIIPNSHQIYAPFEPLLGAFERKNTPREASDTGANAASSYRIIIFALGRFGRAIGLRLHRRGIRVPGMDFNPQAVRRWRDLGLEADSGDASDPEFVAGLPFQGAEWMVTTVQINRTGLSPDDTRRTLNQLARSAGFAGQIAAAAHSSGDGEALFSASVDLVLEPCQNAADRAVELLCSAFAKDRPDCTDVAAEGRATG